MSGPEDDLPGVPPEHRDFARTVLASRLQDPMPTFERLSTETGIPVEDLVHHALIRWVAAGSEALMSVEPAVLRQLFDAARREDWDAVRGLLAWLESGG
jgi:N-glycosylase/DNA lyase